jgi:thiamine biosynthesis lipoprotein
MASPCELLLAAPHQKADKAPGDAPDQKAGEAPGDAPDEASARATALKFGALVAREAWRVEKKFSRYRHDSVTAWIHDHRGTEITLDEETAALIDFARQCHELSDGLFDITSGVLRGAWKFDGSDRVPDASRIEALLPLVGFDKLEWQSPRLRLPAGMELDFGGIGKEYAVDRAYEILAAELAAPFLINFGGDLRANRPPPNGPWQVGIERPDTDRQAGMLLDLAHGALATSGDSRRYLSKDGKRYGHILDPRTGWPVQDAPRSVTVAASSCTEAGLLSTLALLHGADARAFLEAEGAKYWLVD